MYGREFHEWKQEADRRIRLLEQFVEDLSGRSEELNVADELCQRAEQELDEAARCIANASKMVDSAADIRSGKSRVLFAWVDGR